MKTTVLLLQIAALVPAVSPSAGGAEGLQVENGWYVHDGRVVWGFAQHNGWWRPGQRPNITRNAPGVVRPNRTEDLGQLTDAMLRFGYPGFEHNFGLWYDRRRDAHDTARRNDANVVPPLLEQPWARSDRGRAWDALPKYDLARYNDWYFQRLGQFASLCDRKGTILFHNHYMQHALLETDAHYVDFPWRPANCLQDTGMPDRTPAANVFYDVSHPLRRRLHRAYIRKCLKELGDYHNVVFLCSTEYTGPLSFMNFWLDTVFEWEKETGRDVHVAVGACKDVLDQVLSDPLRGPKISTLDLRYWWYAPDRTLYAPRSGRQVAGRYAGTLGGTTPQQVYRQVKQYRLKHPHKGIIHGIAPSRQHAWAALMGGGSMLIGQLPYPDLKDPPEYISPQQCRVIQPTYDFIRAHLSGALQRTRPRDLVATAPERNWCLAETNRTYLIYAARGGQFRLDLSAASGTYRAQWLDPRTGELADAGSGSTEGGRIVTFTAPDNNDWALWLSSPSH